ncbi:MAG: hypothetical protein ACRDNZ_20465 [Streptosporangiaceae bacterium]
MAAAGSLAIAIVRRVGVVVWALICIRTSSSHVLAIISEEPRRDQCVDPATWDFYQMDCYPITGQDELALAAAAEVLRASADPAGRDRAPCAAQSRG